MAKKTGKEHMDKTSYLTFILCLLLKKCTKMMTYDTNDNVALQLAVCSEREVQ